MPCDWAHLFSGARGSLLSLFRSTSAVPAAVMAARKRAGGYLANPSFGEREESDGDEEPPTGDFERASAEELKKRKLIRARRRPAGGRADGSGGGSGGSSVFKGVKLVAGAKPAATAISAASSRPAQPRNPASVFGGGSATAPRAIVSAKAGATFGGLPASKMANPFAAAAKAGTGLASLPSSNPFAKALSGAPSSVLGSVGGGTRPAGAGNADAAAPGRTRPEASRPTPTSSSGPAPSPSAPSASHASGGSSEAGSNRATAGSRQAFYADMRALNADFASWVAQQAKEKPVSSWEQGAKVSSAACFSSYHQQRESHCYFFDARITLSTPLLSQKNTDMQERARMLGALGPLPGNKLFPCPRGLGRRVRSNGIQRSCTDCRRIQMAKRARGWTWGKENLRC